MTRFITNKEGIYDNQEEKQYDFIAYDWIECDIEEVVGLLNTLHQENQRLKHYKLYEDNKRLQTIIADLKEENEELRKDKERLKERLRECGRRLDRFNCRWE